MQALAAALNKKRAQHATNSQSEAGSSKQMQKQQGEFKEQRAKQSKQRLTGKRTQAQATRYTQATLMHAKQMASSTQHDALQLLFGLAVGLKYQMSRRLMRSNKREHMQQRVRCTFCIRCPAARFSCGANTQAAQRKSKRLYGLSSYCEY